MWKQWQVIIRLDDSHEPFWNVNVNKSVSDHHPSLPVSGPCGQICFWINWTNEQTIDSFFRIQLTLFVMKSHRLKWLANVLFQGAWLICFGIHNAAIAFLCSKETFKCCIFAPHVCSFDGLHHTFRTIWMSCIVQFVDLFHNLLTINKYKCMHVDIILIYQRLIAMREYMNKCRQWWICSPYLSMRNFKLNFVYWIIKFKIRNKEVSLIIVFTIPLEFMR